jgi:hypothetical protein
VLVGRLVRFEQQATTLSCYRWLGIRHVRKNGYFRGADCELGKIFIGTRFKKSEFHFVTTYV